MAETIWVKRVIGSRPAGEDQYGFPQDEPIYGEPEPCLADSLLYAYRNGYVLSEAPALVPVLVTRPEPPAPLKAQEVAEDGWPVDAPRRKYKKGRY